jgi:hypothetical protein
VARPSVSQTSKSSSRAAGVVARELIRRERPATKRGRPRHRSEHPLSRVVGVFRTVKTSRPSTFLEVQLRRPAAQIRQGRP